MQQEPPVETELRGEGCAELSQDTGMSLGGVNSAEHRHGHSRLACTGVSKPSAWCAPAPAEEMETGEVG